MWAAYRHRIRVHSVKGTAESLSQMRRWLCLFIERFPVSLEGNMNPKTAISLICGLLISAAISTAVQVDGYCYLENQTNHEGSLVVFQALSPSAATDSTYTNSTGYYQTDVALGLYDVQFSHVCFGYETLHNQFLIETTTLTDITLPDIQNGILISGALSGLLEDTIYAVNGNIWVESGQTLTIEAGADFYFLGDQNNIFNFEIEGQIDALGTESNPIRFMAAATSPGWEGIYDHVFANSRFEYCEISGCVGQYAIELAVSGAFAVVTLDHCTISDNAVSGDQGAVYVHTGTCEISHCTITRNTDTGIYCGVNTNPTISHCTISHNAEYGIRIFDTADTTFIDHCTVSQNAEDGIFILGWANVVINNCTITTNQEAGIYQNTSSSLYRMSVINTIIDRNGDRGIKFSGSQPSSTVIYCDFCNNIGGPFEDHGPLHIGEIVTTNANGDPSDIYYNIFLSPQFVDPSNGDYHLQPYSPCIDAGDPTSPLDPDGTVADIGAFYFDQSTGISESAKIASPSAFHLFQNYPNPFNAATVLRYSIPQASRISLVVYNVMGRKVATLVDGHQDAGYHSVSWNAADLASGVYLYQLQLGGHTLTQKMLLVK
jgi:parallel beta-helix repeat protein